MIIFSVLSVIIQVFAVIYLFADTIYSVRNKKLQKQWNKEKDMRLKAKISNAELCEQYVMFCKRNDCKVDF